MTSPVSYVVSHGIRTEGEKSIDRLGNRINSLYGARVHDCPLPVRHTWTVRWSLKEDTKFLANCIRYTPSPVVVLAHSHGCHIALEAARYADVHALWLFNPAVSTRYDFKGVSCPPERIYCVYSSQDWIVKVGSLLPFHPFGKAGAYGFRNLPPDNNIETSGGHGAAFKQPDLDNWAKMIHEAHK